MTEIHYLYWIKRECHKDILKDGYIGVTKNIDFRFKQHQKHANIGSEYPIHRAIRKYTDIKFKIICIGDREYINNTERLLRPDKYIGWNIFPGGHLPKEETEKMRIGHRNGAITLSNFTKFDCIKILIDYYIRGLTYQEIADKYNTSKSVIGDYIVGNKTIYKDLDIYRNRLKNLKIYVPNRFKEMPEKTYNEILKLKENGTSSREICKIFNLSRSTVMRICYGQHSFTKKFKSYRVVKPGKKTLTYKGETKTVKQWSKDLNIPYQTIIGRIGKNYTIDKCLSKDKLDNKTDHSK